jgi:hypothetical protein
MDAMPSATTAFSQAAVVTTADARDFGRSAVGSTISTDWRVAEVPGAEGLCFVRRGTGDWKGVITVCEGHVAPLGSLPRPVLTAAAMHPASNAGSATSMTGGTVGLWQRYAAGFLMLLGLGLAAKSGAMMMEGARKYG